MFYCSDTLPLHQTLFYYVYSKLRPLKKFEVYNLTKSFYIGILYMMIKQTSANFVFQHIWWRQLTRQYFQYLNGTLQQFFWAKPAKIHINCYHLKDKGPFCTHHVGRSYNHVNKRICSIHPKVEKHNFSASDLI